MPARFVARAALGAAFSGAVDGLPVGFLVAVVAGFLAATPSFGPFFVGSFFAMPFVVLAVAVLLGAALVVAVFLAATVLDAAGAVLFKSTFFLVSVLAGFLVAVPADLLAAAGSFFVAGLFLSASAGGGGAGRPGVPSPSRGPSSACFSSWWWTLGDFSWSEYQVVVGA